MKVPQASAWLEMHRCGWQTVALYAAVIALLGLPLCSVVVPPLGDYPNHLARMHILAAFAHSPALQRNYVVSWKLEPYLGMDLIVPPMIHLMSVFTAGRVFLWLCLDLFVLGTAAVNAALFRSLSPWPAISGLFAYNLVFSFGFVNYLFGVGIGLFAFAGWIVLSRRSIGPRIVWGSILGLAVFFSHFFAFFGYGLCVAGYELGVWLSARERRFPILLHRLVAAGCTAIVPLIIFLMDLREQSGGLTEFGALHYAVTTKIIAWFSPALFPGANFDPASAVLALVVLASGLLLGNLRLAPAMRVPLIVLLLIALAMPDWLSGVWAVDYRLPMVLVFVLIASCSLQPVRSYVAASLAFGMIALLVANIVSTIIAWRPIDAQFKAFRTAINVIPPGAKIIVFQDVAGVERSLQLGPSYMYRHMPALAVIERDAYLPYLFKNPMDTVGAAPALKAIDVADGVPVTLNQLREGADPVKGPMALGSVDAYGAHNYWGDWPRHYDYAIELSFGAKPDLPRQLKLLASGQVFNIYRIDN